MTNAETAERLDARSSHSHRECDVGWRTMLGALWKEVGTRRPTWKDSRRDEMSLSRQNFLIPPCLD
jgi:hypothetical protein